MEKLWNSNYIKIWAINFIIHFAFTLIVPLLPLYLTETFGASKDTIGLVLAGYTVLAIIVRPFSGFVVDSFKRKTVLIICLFFFSAVFFGYLAAGSLALFAVFRTLHGAPFGAVSVAANTVMIDSLPSSRRTEGIGYYGLSNNLATAIGPVLAIIILNAFGGNFDVLFALSIVVSITGIIVGATIKLPDRDFVPRKRIISLDRFFLLKGLKEAVMGVLLGASYGIVSTYTAIYGKQQLGLENGTGFFFTLFAVGLIVSRLTGAHALKRNQVTRNASIGVLVSLCGYAVFALVHNPVGYYSAAFIIGLGNGHMFPALQTMFINLAEHNERGTANSSLLVSWDLGVGLGMLTGGIVSEHFGYVAAFLTALAINASGVAYYFLRTRRHFETNKLR